MAERKLVVVKDSGILHELGGIGGPILTPTRIPIEIILKMINNKRNVFECYPNDPRNESLWVKLTNANYKSSNFNKAQEPVLTADPDTVAPPVQKAPEVEPEQTPAADPDPVADPDVGSQNPDPTVNPETDPEQTQQSTDDEEQKNPEVDPDPTTEPVSNLNDDVQNPETESDGVPEQVAEETNTAIQQTKSSKKKKK